MTDPIVRANDARHFLDSAFWKEIKSDVEGRLQYVRRNADMTANEVHTRAVLMEQLWGFMEDYLLKIAQTGQIEALRLQEEQRKRSLKEAGIALWQRMGRNAL